MELTNCPFCDSTNVTPVNESLFECLDCERQFTPDDMMDKQMEKELQDEEEAGEITPGEAGFVRGYEQARTEDREGV